MTKVSNLFSNVITVLNTTVQQNKTTLQAQELEAKTALDACQVLVDEGKVEVTGKVARLNPDFTPLPTARPLSLGEQAIICAAIESMTFTLRNLHQLTPSESLAQTVHTVWVNEGAFMTPTRKTSGSAMNEAEREANRNRSEADILAELENAEGGCAGGACKL